MSSAFIVLEGGEGSGKSTQVARLAKRLRSTGREVVETFEPGGSALGARLRELFLHGDRPLDARTELFLVAADRARHVHDVIAPALERGEVVVCDRFSPSTLAYQGCARGLDLAMVQAVCDVAEHGASPDVVVVLDVSDAIAGERAPVASDRVERAGEPFHEAVRTAYRDLAPSFGWVVVDANGAVDEVEAKVWAAVADIVSST
jgi:dTMP kinase